jgi:hypothetical protein
MSGLAIRGIAGRVEWAYFTAAVIEGYAVARERPGVWHLTAHARSADVFKMKQKPLVFVAPFVGGEWRWPVQSIRIDRGELVGVLGDPLKIEGTNGRGNAPPGALQA